MGATTTATEVRERPIIFSGPMVQAILAGRKTQTRRIVKPQPHDCSAPGIGPLWSWMGPRVFWLHESQTVVAPEFLPKMLSKWCPYGQPGDRLWVRETWQMRGLMFGRPAADAKLASSAAFHYRATDAESPKPWRPEWGGWRSPIHMPRHASRLTLEITDVRVQRLQEMSEADAQAEGIERLRSGRGFYNPTLSKGCVHFGAYCKTACDAFAYLWESINGKGSWDSNPWVWAITFRVIEGEATR